MRDGGVCPATCTCYLWKPEIVIHLPTVEAFGFCICYFLIRHFVYLSKVNFMFLPRSASLSCVSKFFVVVISPKGAAIAAPATAPLVAV